MQFWYVFLKNKKIEEYEIPFLYSVGILWIIISGKLSTKIKFISLMSQSSVLY